MTDQMFFVWSAPSGVQAVTLGCGESYCLGGGTLTPASVDLGTNEPPPQPK